MSIPTQKDADQTLRYAFDDATNSFRTTASFSGSISVDLDQTTASVAIGDGTALFTGTTVGPHHAEDVNIVQSVSITVTGPLTDTQLRATPVPVSGTVAATQSGTWNINNVSGTVSLPTGAATSSNQTNGTQKSQIVDGSGTVVGPDQTIAGTNYLPVVLAASATSGAAVVVRSIQVAGSDGTNAQTLSTDATGKLKTITATPTAGTVTQAAITVGLTAIRVTVTGSAPSSTRSVLVVNPDSASLAKFYIGSSGVTSSGATRGIQFLGGDQIAFNSDAGDYYIISDTAAQTVYILEQA